MDALLPKAFVFIRIMLRAATWDTTSSTMD
jgi:hypothetical protein